MASAVYDFPSRCCYCKRQIGPDRHSALQLCGCSIAQCTDCVIASIPSHDKTYTGHFSCPICGIDSPYVFSQGVRGHVASAEDLLLSRAFDFFDIRLPRKSSVTIDKYKFLLSCFDDDFFPAEEQQVVRTAVVDYEGVESIDRLRLLLARLECLRGGPYLSDFEVHGKNPEMQISQYDGLPWGPLGHVEISRNMILDQLLQYETPRLMCDLCFTEEVDIAFYSCSCAQFCCVSCTLRVSKRSAKPFTDGPKCPHCRAISPSTFIDTRAAKKETTDTLANIIARNSKHKRYKETSDKDLKELCVNYYCMLNQEHSDGSYAESLSTYTTEQLQLELVCLSIQQESSLKDLSRELGPLRHISCRTHHFYSVFIKLYKGYKRKLNPSKKPSTEVAPGDDLFEMLSINVLRPGSIDELRRQQIENMKMLSHKFSMMIEDNELDSEDMRQILDGHVAPSDFCAFCCPYCLFQGLSEWSLNKHESIFHTKQSPRPTFFIKQVEKKAPVKETKKNRKQEAPAVAEMPTQMIEEQHGKAKKKAGIPLFCHANKSPQSAPPSNSAPAPVASISPPFPPPVPQKLDLSIFDDDEDEEIFVPYTNCVTLAFAPKENTAGALEDEENVYVLPSRRVVARQEESDSDDMEILVHEKVIGAMGAEEEEASDDEEEGMESDKSIVSMKLNEEGGVRKDEDEEEELYFFDGEEGNDGDIVEVIKSDDQNDFGVASSSHAISSALVSNASICGKKEQMYKYEYANLDDETYAPVKLDKNLLLKVTEKIHKKGPSQSATEQSIGLYPVVQPDMSVIDISNNFTIFNNLDLDGQYEIIFQTYRMHAVKGGTAPAELSGSFSLPFYLEMDRRDSVKCYRHAGINRIARGQSESCLKFKGYIQLFTNTFQLVYAAKALSRQFGFGGEIKKFCNWEGQNLAAAKLTLASLFISPRGDDKVPTSHPMKQYVCIIRPYAPYTRDPDPYPAYVAPALGSSTCAHRHFISHAVQAHQIAEKKIKRMFECKAKHRMTQLEQAKLFRENKIKQEQKLGTQQQMEVTLETGPLKSAGSNGKSFLDEEVEDLDHYRAPVIHIPEESHSSLKASSPVNPPSSKANFSYLPPRATSLPSVNQNAKKEDNPYLSIHSSDDEDDDDDDDTTTKRKHKSGVSVVTWVVDTKKKHVEVEDAVQLRPRYVYHRSTYEYEEQYSSSRHGGYGDSRYEELRNTCSERSEIGIRDERVSPRREGGDMRDNRKKSTSANRRFREKAMDRDRSLDWNRSRKMKSNSVPERYWDTRSEFGRDKWRNVGDTSRHNVDASVAGGMQHSGMEGGRLSHYGPTIPFAAPLPSSLLSSHIAPVVSRSNISSASAVPSSAPQPTYRANNFVPFFPLVDKYFDQAYSDDSNSDSNNSHRKRKEAKSTSSSRLVNPISMLGRYYHNKHQGGQN